MDISLAAAESTLGGRTDADLPLATLVEFLDEWHSPVPIATLAKLLQRCCPTMSELDSFVRFELATYRRNEVQRAAHYEVKVICWRQGQQSPWHDHRGSACAVKILRGVATESLAVPASDSGLREAGTNCFYAGEVTACVDRDIHRIAARHGDLISLHVYSPPLTSMTIYPDDQVRCAD